MTIAPKIDNNKEYSLQKAHYRCLLEALTYQLTMLGYWDITPYRLSLETYQNQKNYQGLTRANKCSKTDAEKAVMIKWQLSLSFTISDPSSTINHLNSEIDALKQVLQPYKIQGIPVAIVPVLADDQLVMTFEEQSWQLRFFTMPYFEMGSVKHYMTSNRLCYQKKVQLIKVLAESLHCCHQASWVHGDIKPSNFLIDKCNGNANISNNIIKTYLCDFACARAIQNPELMNDSSIHNSFASNNFIPSPKINLSRKTSANATGSRFSEFDKDRLFFRKGMTHLKGTPAYIAPECWQGSPTSIQSDLYAFGVVMYEIFTEARPYNITSTAYNNVQDKSRAWATAHCQTAIPRLPQLWEHYQSIINKLLAKQVAQRYQNIIDVIDDLYLL